MELTDDQIQEIKEHSALYLTIDEIALLLEVNEEELREEINNQDSLASKAYRKGKLITTLEMRKQEIELAKLGSALSIELVQRYKLEQIISENG